MVCVVSRRVFAMYMSVYGMCAMCLRFGAMYVSMKGVLCYIHLCMCASYGMYVRICAICVCYEYLRTEGDPTVIFASFFFGFLFFVHHAYAHTYAYAQYLRCGDVTACWRLSSWILVLGFGLWFWFWFWTLVRETLILY